MTRSKYGTVKTAVIQGSVSNMTVPEIAKAYGLKPESVRLTAKTLGIVLRKAKRGRKGAQS